jgi:micrococcal nuclease
MIRILILLFLLSGEAFGHSFPNVEFVDNHDGDTITVNIKGVHPLLGDKIPIRVQNIDTAELYGKSYCEPDMAKLAQIKVSDILRNAKRIDLENVKRGSFFRLLADVRIVGPYGSFLLSDYLIKMGYAVPYKGGTKPKINWCTQRRIMRSNMAIPQFP